jgi:hypothetical protein
MNDLNHNIFSNKNEILKSEFDGLVKTHDLEVFVEKALHNYLKTIKSGLKNDEELQTTTELLHLHPIIIVTEKGIKGRVFYRSIYDLEKAECTGTNFEKGGLPEGTIKDWKNGKFIKQGEKWVPYKPSEDIKPNRGNKSDEDNLSGVKVPKSPISPDWTRPSHLSESDWDDLKSIKDYYEAGKYSAALKLASSVDRIVRVEIPKNIWIKIKEGDEFFRKISWSGGEKTDFNGDLFKEQLKENSLKGVREAIKQQFDEMDIVNVNLDSHLEIGEKMNKIEKKGGYAQGYRIKINVGDKSYSLGIATDESGRNNKIYWAVEVLTVSKTPITIKQFDRYFLNNYGYISHSLSEKEVEKFINKHKDKSIEKVADLFSDYLLSQGLADVQL